MYIIDKWIHKTWSMYTVEYYSAIKKEESPDTRYNTDEP